MREVELKLRPVSDLLTEKFKIPDYQRGYRWEDKQVKALLNDLAEFDSQNDPKMFYCLQPLVVTSQKQVSDKDEQDAWEVIDGQQRLTTISLILRSLEIDRYSIRYDRHEAGSSWLDNTIESGDTNTPDAHFISDAYRTIQDWFTTSNYKKDHFKLNVLSARFIWHENSEEDSATDSFMRLNGGKIRLKDCELIRALMLEEGKLSDIERQQVALRWDQMEQRLQDPEFWAFIKGDEKADDGRIGFLFEILEPSPPGSDERYVFNEIHAQLSESAALTTSEGQSKKANQRLHWWKKVEHLFSTLDEWFQDNHVYHLVGFLLDSGFKIKDLIDLSEASLKDEFIIKLKLKIRKQVLKKTDSNENIRPYLVCLRYGKHDALIRQTLLLFNLASLNQDKQSNVRFSFHSYLVNNWDIEHIRATASRAPESETELTEAIKMILDYHDKTPTPVSETLIEEANLTLTTQFKEVKQRVDKLSQSYLSLIDVIEGGQELGASNDIQNLALLDDSTNRSIGNTPFAVKRSKVLEADRQGSYLLPCSRGVFTKSYSKAPINLLHWSPQDAQDYLDAITETLSNFFEGTWKIKK